MDKLNLITKLNEICKKYDKKDYPGIAIGVVYGGEEVFLKGYGEANLDYNIAIDENTVFHACSMTKQFTAACIALLIEEGKLSLEQEVEDFFPEFKHGSEKLTLYHLLYMTNGIPDVYATANLVCGIREDEGITIDEFWRYATACDWNLFKPGENWSYGNTGYFLLGQIVEAVTKTSLSQYADEHIFKPLGMNSTFIRDDRTKIIKNRAVGYSNYEHVHFNDSYKRYTSRNDRLSINEENVEVGGAGQMWTTLKDLLLWDKNFYNNTLGKGSNELIKFFTTSGLLINGEKCGYGCGLFIGDFHGNKLVHHGGLAGGYSAYYAQLPEKKSSVIVLGNHTDFYSQYVDSENALIINILNLLTESENKITATKEQKPDNINAAQIEFNRDLSGEYINDFSKLKVYEGSYCCQKLGTSYKVKIEKDKLFIKNEDLHNNALDLYYTLISNDTFISDHNKYIGNKLVTFKRDGNGEINSFSYEDSSQTLRENFIFLKIK